MPGTYDPFEPAVIADPYPYYGDLLRGPRVHRDEARDFFALTRYEDVARALREHRSLSSAEGVGYQKAGLPMMLTLDPPDHTRLRRIVSREFTPRNLERWRAIVDDLARDAVARLVERDGADFVEEVAGPLPVGVIGGMLGLPDEDLPALRRMSDDAVEAFKMARPQSRIAERLNRLLTAGRVVETFTRFGMRFPRPTGAVLRGLAGIANRAEGESLWGDDIARSVAAVADLQAYCGELVRERQRRPGDDLVSQLIRPHEEGSLSSPQVFWFFFLLLLAGHETTTNLLGNLVNALIANPEEWRALREDPSLVPSAVNEALRFESPVQMFFRTALEPYRVGDVEIPRGARVQVLYAAANRDPAHYDEPDAFRVRRNPTDHLGFGGGIHYCLGASLAEMEGRAVLRELVTRAKKLEIAGPPVRTENPILRGFKRFPLRCAVDG
ncbi:MAG: cytochrome P450 [Candidatus Binatia bacterium]